MVTPSAMLAPYVGDISTGSYIDVGAYHEHLRDRCPVLGVSNGSSI